MPRKGASGRDPKKKSAARQPKTKRDKSSAASSSATFEKTQEQMPAHELERQAREEQRARELERARGNGNGDEQRTDGNGDTQPEPDRLAEPQSDEQLPRLPFAVVGIGASAGGIEAYTEFLDTMPPESGMAFVLIQHLSPKHESMVAEILQKHTEMVVKQVEDSMPVQPNHVYVIRPGHTLTIRDGMLHLGDSLETAGHRRPVDDFFRSLAEEQRERAIGIVMSGMGSNGTAGAQALKTVGGVCIAQDPESAKFDSMPRSLISSGYADYVLAPREMPDILGRYASHPYASGKSPAPDRVALRERQTLSDILAILRTRTKQDFTGYKKPTVVRRIQRRMGLNQLASMGDYVRALRQTPGEVNALADDLLIHVTGFFRDTEAWKALADKVIDPMVAERSANASIRAWVTACSSGEEAYSLGMLLMDAATRADKPLDIKVFATDMAERSLANARAGVYPAGIEGEIDSRWLDKYFEKEDAHYRVNRELREAVIFAPQNILQDPPFSKLDICTCRNLLIYLEPQVQQRVLNLLHFGLRENGVLFLGNSETVDDLTYLFKPIDKKYRIFRRVGPLRQENYGFPLQHAIPPRAEAVSEKRALSRASIPQITNRVLLEKYAPAAVVVDRDGHIVYFHGTTDVFLEQPRGEPTRELLSLAREFVSPAVRAAFHKSVESNMPASARDGVIDTPQGRMRIEVAVAPFMHGVGASFFLVSFEQRAEPVAPARSTRSHKRDREMAEELQRVRDELQSTIEQLQTSNEDMKASHEEITSINEELQSTNEELETSKEELQSLNEELTTVNNELQAKMEELERTSSDLQSLLSSTDIAVIFLDAQFRIRRFTSAVKELVELIPTDLGRPLSDLAQKFSDPELQRDAEKVLKKLVPIEREVGAVNGRWYQRRVLPYRTSDNRIDGIVITFMDVTDRKRAEIERTLLSEMVNAADDSIIGFRLDGTIVTWNASAEHLFGYTAAEALGKNVSILAALKNRAEMDALMDHLREGDAVQQLQTVALTKSGQPVEISITASPVPVSGEQIASAIVHLVGDGESAEGQIRQVRRDAASASTAKDHFLASISHELRTPLSAILLWTKILRDKQSIRPVELREALDAIQVSADAQRRLIEDLLDSTRISQGKLRLELTDTDLPEVITAAVEAIRPTADAKSITLQVDVPKQMELVRADPARLQQIVWILLTNAVKFTPVGGKVSVSLKRAEKEIIVTVSDTGRGIGSEFLPAMFKPFMQADAPGSQGVGLGLGLAIARQLVELHGGNINAGSAGPGQGATFTVRLPLVTRKRAATTARVESPEKDFAFGSESPTLASTTILLVEDNPETRRAAASILSHSGASVRSAASGEEGLEEFKRERPHIIVSDIALPGIDGNEMLRRIRAIDAQAAAVPAIAISAFTQDRDRRKAIEAGYQYHLAKPIETSVLLRAIAEAIWAP